MVFGKLLTVLSSKEDSLRRAAGEGDEMRVQKLLKSGALPDPRKPQHTSALQLAAKDGHMGCVKALVEAGADVNRFGDSSPLLDAAAHGHVEVVSYLLENKADPTKACNRNTALHMASRFGHQAVNDLLSPLLDMPKAVAAANDEGKTPLMMACSLAKGGEAVVKFLLGVGADPAAADLAGNTALHHAAVSGNLLVVQLLVASGKRGVQSQSMVNVKGRTPLHLAAVFGHPELVDLLVKHKQADATAKDKEGSTVLHMVCKSVLCDTASQATMARIVVEAGADPDAADEAGYTAAHFASSPALKELLGATEATAAAKPAPMKPSAGAVESPELATSSSGAATQQAKPAAAASKPGRAVAGAMADLGSAGGAGTGAGGDANESWLVKEALRHHSSEEGDGGWKLKTAVAGDSCKH